MTTCTTKNNKQIVSITIISMLCVTALGLLYVGTGHDGVGFAATMTVVAGLAGFLLPSPIQK